MKTMLESMKPRGGTRLTGAGCDDAGDHKEEDECAADRTLQTEFLAIV